MVNRLVADGCNLAKYQLKDDKPMLRQAELPDISRSRLDIILSSSALNLLALALPVMILQVYDRIIPNNATDTLTLLVTGVGIALLFEAFFRLARSYITAFNGAKFEHIAGCRAMYRTLGAKISRYEEEATGVHLHRFNAIDSLREFMSGSNILVFIDLPFAVIFIAMVGYIGGSLVWAPIILLAFFGLVTFLVGSGLRKALTDKSVWEDRRYNFLIEVLTGIHTVKGLSLEAQMIRRYERLQETTAGTMRDVAFKNSVAQNLGAIFSQVTLLSVAAIGSVLVIDGQLSIGGLAACTLLSGRALQPLMRAMGVWTHYQNIKIARDRVTTLLNLPQSPNPAEDDELTATALGLGNPNGIDLTFEDVNFKLSEDGPPIFEHVNAHFPAGTTSALVGANSTGKTTLLWLALGMHRPTSGRILLGGKDLSEIPRAVVHELVAYLPTNGNIFHGTILENLTTFRKGRYIDEAMALSEELGLDEVIKRLPFGYDTVVGDGAADGLPGGIRQRISIARALVSKPKLILFDEANTSLDAHGDEILKKAMQNQQGKATILLVSHRPSLLKISNQGFRIENSQLTPASVEDLTSFGTPQKKQTPNIKVV
ncbi:ATP-binding cassette domain-containing protein [Sneathiella sp. P13V-1]|uniref:peptidase domain-containing ABC transporter n=1 Tax=Sneathiella sp. P13V-1 TaxID=2697366 RepID=UPI00187B3449|nr:ABC transporter transmembrane domain-containing protein [Sneathiella sp. P13V-1]MBE7638202.1 ATP-binding cassette domain-containing protein [Sneathiella sp. P13V-1]